MESVQIDFFSSDPKIILKRLCLWRFSFHWKTFEHFARQVLDDLDRFLRSIWSCLLSTIDTLPWYVFEEEVGFILSVQWSQKIDLKWYSLFLHCGLDGCALSPLLLFPRLQKKYLV